MAIQILRALANNVRPGNTTPKHVIHGTHHDLESFVWVTVYAAVVHELIEDRGKVSFLTGHDKNMDPFETVRSMFGRASYHDTLGVRGSSLLEEGADRLLNLISDQVLRDLCDDLITLVGQQNPTRRQPAVYLTYDTLLAAFEKADAHCSEDQ